MRSLSFRTVDEMNWKPLIGSNILIIQSEIVQFKLLSIYTSTKKAVLTLDHDGYNKIPKCDHSNESYWAVQSSNVVRVCLFVRLFMRGFLKFFREET